MSNVRNQKNGINTKKEKEENMQMQSRNNGIETHNREDQRISI